MLELWPTIGASREGGTGDDGSGGVMVAEVNMAGETLEQLDGVSLARPEFDSYLVASCHRLWTKPLDEFTVEDLRIMVGQKLALAHLVPRALNVLEDDPLTEGDSYPGDLLVSVVRAEPFVASSPGLLRRLLGVVGRRSPGWARRTRICERISSASSRGMTLAERIA